MAITPISSTYASQDLGLAGGIFPTKGSEVVKQLAAQLADQRKRRKTGRPATDSGTNMISGQAGRDLMASGVLGSRGY